MKNSKRDAIYLACPLTDSNHEIEILRFKSACMAAAYLMATRDVIVFSPLSHSCPVDHFLPIYHEKTGMKLRGHEFWVEIQDQYWLDHCSKIAILALPGWEKSTGVIWEKEYMEAQGKPVEILNPAKVESWYQERKGSMVNTWI